MKKWTPISLAVLTILAAAPVWAQGTNPEDEMLEDADVPAVAATPGTQGTTTPVGVADGLPDGVTLDGTPPDGTPGATSSTRDNALSTSGETITIPRDVWEQLQRDVAELKASRAAINGAPTETVNPETDATETGAPASRNYLTLPDISLVLQAKGLLSSDKRDEDRKRVGFSEGELVIQGYVYPNVRADAMIVGAPAEDEFGFEEAFLTFEGVRKGLNVNVGRKFAPFGRTGELHNHSWMYPRQLLPIRNLVAEEALVGDGVNLHYLFPTKGKLFLRGSLGFFNGEGTETGINLTDPSDPFFGGLPGGSGSGFNSRFYNARLWGGLPLGKDGEIEFGVSHARGKSSILDDGANQFDGRVQLNGVDLSYRKFMNGGKRLLLRGEYFQYKPSDLPTVKSSGYYGLASLKLDPRRDIGLLYEKSDFPNAPGQKENAFSLLYTKQLTEQFYIRLMGTRGERAGDSYNELRLQFTAGIGPHTHALE